MVNLDLDFPEGFFAPETRSGYFVSARMKKVWAVELDLLWALLKVCQKHQIKIFASGGTLLGAVRHQGFIPWDDDIDMMMFREDYEKLCKVAALEFQPPYFFQTYRTDKVHRAYAKLRNSETTAVLPKETDPGLPYNRGIFIDIFPLDNVETDKVSFKRQARKVRRWRYLALAADDFLSRYYKVDKKGPLWASCVKLLHPLLGKIFERHNTVEYCMSRHDKACALCKDDSSKEVMCITFDNFEKHAKPKLRSDFQEITCLPFEFLQIPAGTGFEHALTNLYGDWRKPVKGASNHERMVFDPDTPYKEYVERGRGV